MSRPKKYSLKRNKRKQSNKSKTNKRRRVRSVMKKGGGCNCGMSTPQGFFSGGSSLPSTNAITSMGGDKMYSLNPYNTDPNYMTVDSRGTGNFVQESAKINGGKGKKNKQTSTKTKRNGRKMKGGVGISTAGIVNGIQSILPSSLPGASDFSAGSNPPMSLVPFSRVTNENPMPPP